MPGASQWRRPLQDHHGCRSAISFPASHEKCVSSNAGDQHWGTSATCGQPCEGAPLRSPTLTGLKELTATTWLPLVMCSKVLGNTCARSAGHAAGAAARAERRQGAGTHMSRGTGLDPGRGIPPGTGQGKGPLSARGRRKQSTSGRSAAGLRPPRRRAKRMPSAESDVSSFDHAAVLFHKSKRMRFACKGSLSRT